MVEPNNNGPRYEVRDATLRPLVLFLGGLALLCAVVFVAMVGLFELFERTIAEAQAPSGQISPLADKRVLPDQPRLQIDEPADLDTFNRRQRALASTYGWVDKSQGIVRVPIERAIELVLARGLPSGVTQMDELEAAPEPQPSGQPAAPNPRRPERGSKP